MIRVQTLWLAAFLAVLGLYLLVELPPLIDELQSSGPIQRPTPVTPNPNLPRPYQVLQGAAYAEVGVLTTYDAAYVPISYPNGDVPPDRGACTEVVIRALRQVGIDLQSCVHEDIENNRKLYPSLWGLKAPDANIDHRRLPNLMTYYKRHGWSLPITKNPADYQGGDIIVWRLPSGALHTGMVFSREDGSLLMIHNLGQGAQCENALFRWTQAGHYRIPITEIHAR